MTIEVQRRRLRTGFTLVETTVSLVTGTLTLACALAMAAVLDEEGGISVSQSNLITLGGAHELYSNDHDGRVFSLSPDDYGAYVNCADYIENRGCIEPLMLGWGSSESGSCDCAYQWGYWIDHQQLCESVGTCANAVMTTPFDFQMRIGAFRVPNCEQFNAYVNGGYYDSTYFAPLDTLTHERASPMLDQCCGFTYDPEIGLIWPSYAFSPAAMWDPGVLRSNADGGYQAPHSYDESHRAPQVNQASYPELKSLLFEHNWNHGQPGLFNPLFAGENTPYYFNHGRDARPLTCFFDGSVRMLPTGVAADDDARIIKQTGGLDGLWHRDTDIVEIGYYSLQSHDGVHVSHNILTTDGILGRDVLSTIVRDPDITGDGAVDGFDLTRVLGRWSAEASWYEQADLDADGRVDGFDLKAVLGNWSY